MTCGMNADGGCSRLRYHANIMHVLRQRELMYARPGSQLNRMRRVFETIHPNDVITDVEIPACHMRRFTPDGRFLLCFSRCLHLFEVYLFRDPSISSFMMSHPPENRSKDLFDALFTLHYQTRITTGSDVLCKDFCLITDSMSHILLASHMPHGDNLQHNPTNSPINNNNMGPSVVPSSLLEDVTIHMVHLESGTVVDRVNFHSDFINLHLHHCVYLYRNLLAVLSLHRQTIHIFQVKSDSWSAVDCNATMVDSSSIPAGQLVSLRYIGHSCREDDEAVFKRGTGGCSGGGGDAAPAATVNSPHWNNAWTPHPVSPVPSTSPGIRPSSLAPPSSVSGTSETRPMLRGVKQRMLTWMWRRCMSSDEPTKTLRHFYFHFEQLAALVMTKVQFIDEGHLLIKYGVLDSLTGAVATVDGLSLITFLVVYNINSTQVIAVYDNTSEVLLHLFENCCDFFRVSSFNWALPLIGHVTSCSSNDFSREQLQLHQRAVRNARNGGSVHAIKRVLSALPFNCQSFNESPYFDHALFSYDEKAVSAAVWHKPCLDFPVKFYLRSTGAFRFRIDSDTRLPNEESSGAMYSRTKRMVSHIVHPYYPLFISLQHTYQRSSTVTNFHVYFGK